MCVSPWVWFIGQDQAEACKSLQKVLSKKARVQIQKSTFSVNIRTPCNPSNPLHYSIIELLWTSLNVILGLDSPQEVPKQVLLANMTRVPHLSLGVTSSYAGYACVRKCTLHSTAVHCTHDWLKKMPIPQVQRLQAVKDWEQMIGRCRLAFARMPWHQKWFSRLALVTVCLLCT